MAIFGYFSPVFRGVFICDEIIFTKGTFGQKRYHLPPKTEARPQNNTQFESVCTDRNI